MYILRIIDTKIDLKKKIIFSQSNNSLKYKIQSFYVRLIIYFDTKVI